MESATLLTLRVPAFEAAVRKAVDPSLGGRPVVVATSFKPLGRVVAACPVARKAGVGEGMPYPLARGRCPDACFFVPDAELSRRASRTLVREAASFSPQVERVGNGLVLLDTRGTERLWGDSGCVAERLGRDITRRLHLPTAAGVASRRPWSLLASRAAGDAGVCLVRPGDEETFLDRVPPDWVDGISARTRARLLELNIRSLGQMRQFSHGQLRSQFGPSCGELLWNVLSPQGRDGVASVAGAIVEEGEADGIRVEAALTEATVAREQLQLVVINLAARVAATLRARNLGAGRLRLTLLHADGVLKSAQARTGGYIQSDRTLRHIAQQLLDKVFARRIRATRLWLAADRMAAPERQGVLFPTGEAAAEQVLEERNLLATMDRIRSRFGDDAIKPGTFSWTG